MALIQLKKINKIFNSNTSNPFQALKNVNLEVNGGDFISIMGPSGSGKSTLMNIIGMLDVPDSGQYFLNAVNITGLRKKDLPRMRREEVGFIFQTFNLLPRLTVAKNIALPLTYTNKTAKEKQLKINELIELVRLEHRKKYLPVNLSGGEKQRVAIARALVNNPKVILADEPTGNLDSKSGCEIMTALSHLNKTGRTIILVTHDPEIDKYADRHFKLVDGQLNEK